MVKLTTLLVLSAVVTYALEIVLTPNRSMIAVIAALLLAHVLPTWFLAFHDFDREDERQQAFIYANSGPVGFGIMIASLTANNRIEIAVTAESVTVALLLITVLASSVAIAYWGSSGQSRKVRWELFLHCGYAAELVRLLATMKLHRFHNRADAWCRAIADGRFEEILTDGDDFRDKEFIEILDKDGVSNHVLNQGLTALSNLKTMSAEAAA